MLTKNEFIQHCLPQLGSGELTEWEPDAQPNSQIIRALLAGADGARRLIIKQLDSGHLDGRFGKTGDAFWRERFDAQLDALRACAESPDARLVARTPKPLAWDAATLSLCMEEVPGRKLDTVFDRAVRWMPSNAQWEQALRACRESGEWLAAFHALDAQAAGARQETGGFAYWREYCAPRLERVMSCASLGKGVRSRLARAHGRIEAAWPVQGPMVPLHNDFQSHNILWSDRGVVVLDFTGVARGPREWDAIKFMQSIAKPALTRPFVGARIEKLQQAFRDGYGCALDETGAVWRVWEFAWALDKLSDLAEDGLLARPGVAVRLKTRALLMRILGEG